MAPGKSSLHLSYKGEHGIALKSRQRNRASRRIEGGISGLSRVAAGNPGFPRLVKKSEHIVTSLVIQWIRIYLPIQGT